MWEAVQWRKTYHPQHKTLVLATMLNLTLGRIDASRRESVLYLLVNAIAQVALSGISL
jgi:hypothetical protein